MANERDALRSSVEKLQAQLEVCCCAYTCDSACYARLTQQEDCLYILSACVFCLRLSLLEFHVISQLGYLYMCMYMCVCICIHRYKCSFLVFGRWRLFAFIHPAGLYTRDVGCFLDFFLCFFLTKDKLVEHILKLSPHTQEKEITEIAMFSAIYIPSLRLRFPQSFIQHVFILVFAGA